MVLSFQKMLRGIISKARAVSNNESGEAGLCAEPHVTGTKKA
jgi:hypothetical protein